MPERIPQSTTIRVPLQAYQSADHITPATGKTIACTISKNGAAYGNPSAGATVATEVASGSYYVNLSTTDTATLGPLYVLGTASGTDAVVAIYTVVDPKVQLDLTQAVPSSNTAGTLGDALNAARAQGFGNWAIVGNALNLYGADNTTIVHTFQLDSVTAPTSRTT